MGSEGIPSKKVGAAKASSTFVENYVYTNKDSDVCHNFLSSLNLGRTFSNTEKLLTNVRSPNTSWVNMLHFMGSK